MRSVIGMGTKLDSPEPDTSGEMVMPPMDEVKGASEASDRCLEWVPILLILVDGECSGELLYGSSDAMGVMPNANAASNVDLERRKPPWVELARLRGNGRRGEGLVL